MPAQPRSEGKWSPAGGRVLGVTASAPSLEEALQRAYQALGEIHFEGMYYRRDIGHRALKEVNLGPS